MNSLSLRAFSADFNGAAIARPSSSSRGSGSNGVSTVVACASESSGSGGGRSRSSRSSSSSSSSSSSKPSSATSSSLSRSQTYALLKQQMEVAAKSEVSVVRISLRERFGRFVLILLFGFLVNKHRLVFSLFFFCFVFGWVV